MKRQSFLMWVVFFLLCYALATLFKFSAKTPRDTGQAPAGGVPVPVQEVVLPPEQLPQFKGISVYKKPKKKDRLWINPSDKDLMPPKDPNDPYTGVM